MVKRGGRVPTRHPVGWTFLDHHRHDGYTIRWRRGDPVAYVLAGHRLGDHSMAEVLDTIPVPQKGWTDLAEVRAFGDAVAAASGREQQQSIAVSRRGKKMYCPTLEDTVPKTSTPSPMVFISGRIQLMAAQALELAARHWGPDPPDPRGRHGIYTQHDLHPSTSPHEPKPPPWVTYTIVVVVILALALWSYLSTSTTG